MWQKSKRVFWSTFARLQKRDERTLAISPEAPHLRRMWHWKQSNWDSPAAERAVEQAAAAKRVCYRSWRWPPLKTYRGFSSEERIRGWQKVWAARELGILPAPTRCSICLSACAGQYHSEDYSRPLDAKPVCRRCHIILHQRFQRPQIWEALVSAQNGRCGWFRVLTTDASSERPSCNV